ncbi:MAG: asparaginase [Eubacteriales bacterium]|nr:asparaginase [Eubacteriales bacterium]
MKHILFIATGGTIASKKTENGLTPQIKPEEMLSYIPSVSDYCEITAIQPFNLDSTNVTPENWKAIVQIIKQNYFDFDGFVIAHGTDTMAYTAAALSYMVQNSSRPIVITGSQKPINLDVTDARTNLLDSFIYASANDSQGVQIVFDGKVIAGTRAKKVRSKSYNAFSSIDFPSLAVIQDRRIMRYISMLPYKDPVRFYENMNDNVFLLKLLPGIKPDLLSFIFDRYDAIIVESFGVGGIPVSIRDAFFALCKENPEKLIIMATQVAHEGSDMTVYEVGNTIKKMCNILESYDMTPEAVCAKAMWILANSTSADFYRPINYDTIWPNEN